MDQNAMFSPEDEAAFQAAERKKQIANMLLQRGLQGPAPMQQGRIASRMPALAALAPIFQSAIGGWQQKKATAEQADVKQKAATTYASGVEGLMNAPNKDIAITSALGSAIPGLRQMAEKQRIEQQAQIKADAERQQAAVIAGAKGLMDSGDLSAGLGALRDRQLPGNYSLRPQEAPDIQFKQTPDGKNLPFVTETDKYGRKSVKFGPAGSSTTTNVNLPGTKQLNAAEESIGKMVGPELKEIRTNAQKRISELQAAERMSDLLSDPRVITGFAANAKTGIASFGAALGITDGDIPGKTQSLLTDMAKQVLANAKNLPGPASDKDILFLQKAAAGEITFERGAIQRLVSISKLVAHNDLVDLKQAYTGTLEVPGALETGANRMFQWPSGWNFKVDPKLYKETGEGTNKYQYIGDRIDPTPATAAAVPAGGGLKPIDKMTREEKLRELEERRGKK